MVLKNLKNKLLNYLKQVRLAALVIENFPGVAEKYKLNYVVKRNATIKELMACKREGYIIIVGYFYPPEKIGHYSILKKIDSNSIQFWDPLCGLRHRYSLKYFLRIWRNDPRYDDEEGWFFAVKNI